MIFTPLSLVLSPSLFLSLIVVINLLKFHKLDDMVGDTQKTAKKRRGSKNTNYT